MGAKSMEEVNEMVHELPAQDLLRWKITQLEPFSQRADIEKKAVQELRAKK
jgi:hypothetical protein